MLEKRLKKKKRYREIEFFKRANLKGHRVKRKKSLDEVGMEGCSWGDFEFEKAVSCVRQQSSKQSNCRASWLHCTAYTYCTALHAPLHCWMSTTVVACEARRLQSCQLPLILCNVELSLTGGISGRLRNSS